jgi:hypothetical protein
VVEVVVFRVVVFRLVVMVVGWCAFVVVEVVVVPFVILVVGLCFEDPLALRRTKVVRCHKFKRFKIYIFLNELNFLNFNDSFTIFITWDWDSCALNFGNCSGLGRCFGCLSWSGLSRGSQSS